MSDPTEPRSVRVCAADIGKTRCRLAVCDVEPGPGERPVRVHQQVTVDGVPGLATAPETTLAHLRQALAGLGDALAGVEAYGIGAAGARLAPAAADELAGTLGAELGRPVIVASDVLVAHLGALGGQPGTVTIAGTGAVAYHVGADGTIAMADGWGPIMGDLGGGFWIGMRGLQQALVGADRRGPQTSLTHRATAWAPDGQLDRLPAVLHGDGFSRQIAGFARAVLEEASAGDGVAAAVRAEAVVHLADTTATVADANLPAAVVGGLHDDQGLAAALDDELIARGVRVVPARGTGLDGAALLGAYAAGRMGQLPHEPHLHRGPSTSR